MNSNIRISTTPESTTMNTESKILEYERAKSPPMIIRTEEECHKIIANFYKVFPNGITWKYTALNDHPNS